uniref:Uncharacterized protein n=1 Tax=Brassica oleracea TaxID=3712 RepID=A0A3P6CNT5_BRAOL|nr:unnamed protein product [Brassica oleracea]
METLLTFGRILGSNLRVIYALLGHLQRNNRICCLTDAEDCFVWTNNKTDATQ